MKLDGFERLTETPPTGKAARRRQRVIDACDASPWADAVRGGALSFVSLVRDLATRGVFDCVTWRDEEESPDDYLDEGVLACLENRQYVLGSRYGVTSAMCFCLEYGSVIVACCEQDGALMRFALAPRDGWQGFRRAPVTLTFRKSSGIDPEAYARFLELADLCAGMRPANVARKLAAVDGTDGPCELQGVSPSRRLM